MTFQWLTYWIFLLLAWGLVAVSADPRRRQAVILGLSYLFYGSWNPWFPLLLMVSTLLNYVWGEVIRRRACPWTLVAGLLSNVALLGFFKYGGTLGAPSGIFLPVGLSFFTFQGMSHLLDTYRGGHLRPTLLEFALFMAFWPTVLMGPITRAGEMVEQFRRPGRPTWDDVAVGSRRILMGLVMKMVVADTLANGIQVGEGVVFGFDRLTGGWGGLDAWFLAVGYGFQLYFDFAGYSHVAIGSAQVLGIRVRENFDHPYLADSPAAFWARWHMSLSQWIRDYLFFPIAVALPTRSGRYLAVIVSMLVFGAWHGVGWTFLCWGLYHGLLQVGHRALQPWLPDRIASPTVRRAWGVAAWLSTFLLVSWGWLLFRSANLAQAWAMTRAILDPSRYLSFSLRPNFYILVVLVAGFYFAYGWGRGAAVGLVRRWIPDLVVGMFRPVYYAALLLAIVIWSLQSSVFVYFQF